MKNWDPPVSGSPELAIDRVPSTFEIPLINSSSIFPYSSRVCSVPSHDLKEVSGGPDPSPAPSSSVPYFKICYVIIVFRKSGNSWKILVWSKLYLRKHEDSWQRGNQTEYNIQGQFGECKGHRSTFALQDQWNCHCEKGERMNCSWTLYNDQR